MCGSTPMAPSLRIDAAIAGPSQVAGILLRDRVRGAWLPDAAWNARMLAVWTGNESVAHRRATWHGANESECIGPIGR
jgi:hypothetical protein